MSVAAEAGRVGLTDASLTLCAGEIVGIAGVSGNGQAALAGLVAGTARPSPGGAAALAGARLPSSPRGAVAAGVASSRRIATAKASCPRSPSPRTSSWKASIRRRSGAGACSRREGIEARAREAITSYDVRCPGPSAPIRLLSGGNIQKVILARVLDREPRLVLANQPA